MKQLILSVLAVLLTLTPLMAGTKKVEGVLNLNTATLEELIRLPGIGKTKAEAIVSYRQSHPFKSPQELTEVKGIGPKLFQKLEGHLTVQGATTLKEASLAPARSAAVTQ